MTSRVTAKRSGWRPLEPFRGAAVATTATALSLAASGCGLGPGEADSGEATLRVTSGYGSELMLDAAVANPTESDTVIRVLDREAEVKTRFGGLFVQSIDGVEGAIEGGRSSDWFFYVNGVEASVGAAEVRMHAGDRIWWDHRDWTDAMRVPAVVGSWPEPFAQASAGADVAPVRVECATDRSTCDDAAQRLAEEGVDASVAKHEPGGADDGTALRMIVGDWARVRRDPIARVLDQGPAASGVFAAFEVGPDRTWTLEGLDAATAQAGEWGSGSGLVAALRWGEEQPVWIVTGTDRAGTAAAAQALSEDALRDRYAVAVADDEATGLPVTGAGE